LHRLGVLGGCGVRKGPSVSNNMRERGTRSCADDDSLVSNLPASRAMPSVLSTAPGAITLLVTPSGPYSSATLAMRESTPALAADMCACSGRPV
jgi:hypothetical protein